MKILYACHQFLPEYYTGTERYTLELAKQIQKMGHHVMVLTYAYLSNEGMQPFAKGQLLSKVYQYDSVPVIAWRHTDLYQRVVEPEFSFRLQDDHMEDAFEKFLQEHTFDILHITHLMRVSPILKVAKRHGLPVVMHLTDYWMICPKATLLRADNSLCEGPDFGRNCRQYCYEAKWLEALIERHRDAQKSLRLVDLVISPSQYLIDVFKKNGVDTSCFIHCKHGFDYSKVKFVKRKLSKEGIINFGFLGTILPHKGVHILIEAFKKVSLDNNIRLKIYGGYFDRSDYYQSLLKKATGDPRIEFCGEYDFEDIGSMLKEIDVVVVPSIWYENAPLTISTAHSFGIPVIATGIGGMAEIVQDGVNGFVFHIGDSDDLAKKIHMIAINPDLLEKFSRNITPPPRIEGDAFYLETIYKKLLRNEALVVRPQRHNMGHVPRKNTKEDRSKQAVMSSRAARWWDEHKWIAGPPPDYWGSNFLIRAYQCELVTGDPQLEPFVWFIKKYIQSPLSRGLSIGCGTGGLERHAMSLGACEEIDAYDISEESIKIAHEKALEGRYKINYHVADLNTIKLGENLYDVVFSCGCLHHIKNLEHLFGQIKKALKPGGLFYLDEYIGPSRLQYSELQVRVINDILSVLPAAYTNSDSFKPPDIQHMIAMDPSEAVRSAEIKKLTYEHFEVLDFRGFGGPILHPLYPLFNLQNFPDLHNENHQIIIKLLAYLEKMLIESGYFSHDFAIIVARNHK